MSDAAPGRVRGARRDRPAGLRGTLSHHEIAATADRGHRLRARLLPPGSAIVVAALVAAPLALVTAALRSTPRELDVLQQHDAPVGVVVDGTSTWQPATAASVTLHFADASATSVVAPPWKGTVTAVVATPGSELHAGAPLLEIDGIRRLFAPSPAPFWRVPAWGDHGPDIDGLAALFTALSLLPSQAAGTPFGADHVQAVERLAALVGAPPTSTLDLGWLVWAPVPTLRVPAWSITLGAAAPTAGTALFTLPREIASVEITATAGPSLSDDTLRRSTIDFGGGDDVAGAVVLDAPRQVPALRRASEAAAAPAGAGPAGSVPDLPVAAEATTTVKATARGPRLDHVAALPLRAVVTDADGSHCVVTLDQRAVPVEVVGSDSARVYVRGADERQVTANPASSFGTTRCH